MVGSDEGLRSLHGAWTAATLLRQLREELGLLRG